LPEIVQDALVAVGAESDHWLNLERRCSIYDAYGNPEDTPTRKGLLHLAIISVRRALTAEPTHYAQGDRYKSIEEALRRVDLAERLRDGRINLNSEDLREYRFENINSLTGCNGLMPLPEGTEEVQSIQENGQDVYLSRVDAIALRVSYLTVASVAALNEALYGFRHPRRRNSVLDFDKDRIEGENNRDDERTRGRIEPRDAAGYAALAYSTDPSSGEIDAECMLAYWTWWLTNAVPEAWEVVQHGA